MRIPPAPPTFALSSYGWLRRSRCAYGTDFNVEKTAKVALRSFSVVGHNKIMYYVYLLRSHKNKMQTYIGSTSDLKSRFVAHNAGQSPHTSKFKPWDMICYIAFKTKAQAEKFETYLKAGSGKAFANKHLLT